MDFGHRMDFVAYGALTTGAGETTVYDEYIQAGTQGLIVDVFHTSAGSGTVVYKIYAYHFTDDNAAWTQSFTAMLTSASINKDTGTRLVVDPRVAAVTNTHAQTVLPYRVKISATVSSADATGVYLGVSHVE